MQRVSIKDIRDDGRGLMEQKGDNGCESVMKKGIIRTKHVLLMEFRLFIRFGEMEAH
jgi:hypothetical protein